MTTMMNEQLERRISEKLDGRLDDAATTELLRELMRDPKARATHDTWQRNDRHAAAALRAVVDLPHRPFVIQPRKKSSFPWAQLLATAALIVMAFGVWTLVTELNEIESTTNQPSQVASTGDANETADPMTAESIMAEPLDMAQTDRWWRTNASPVQDGQLVETAAVSTVVDQQTPQNAMQVNDRAMLGVIDEESGRAYWMEVRTDQTVIQAVGGEM